MPRAKCKFPGIRPEERASGFGNHKRKDHHGTCQHSRAREHRVVSPRVVLDSKQASKKRPGAGTLVYLRPAAVSSPFLSTLIIHIRWVCWSTLYPTLFRSCLTDIYRPNYRLSLSQSSNYPANPSPFKRRVLASDGWRNLVAKSSSPGV